MEIEKDLESEYSPSKSSKRFIDPDDAVTTHMRVATEGMLIYLCMWLER